MASPRFSRELARELPLWVRDGLIAPENADALARRYPVHAEPSAGRHLQIFLGVLCALLIGAGVLLLISHNWDCFAPGVRLAFAWAPLAAAAGFGIWTVARHDDEPAWCEPAALFLAAAAASAIAIVSQVYQCVGTLTAYLRLLLALMILPMYALRSTALSAAFAVGFFALLTCDFSPDRAAPVMMLLALAAMPHLWRSATGGVSVGMRQLNQLAFAAVLLCLNLVCMMQDNSLFHALLWPLLCGVILQAGWHASEKRDGAMNSWLVVGSGGFLVLMMLGTYREAWRNIRFDSVGGWPVWILAGLLALVWLGFGWRFRRSPGKSYAACYPLVFLLCLLLGMRRHADIAMLLGNLYVLILGAGMLVTGFRTRSPWCMNRGLAVLAVLIFLRFCASDDILLRAMIFLGLGVAVGAVNLVFARKLRKMEKAA